MIAVWIVDTIKNSGVFISEISFASACKLVRNLAEYNLSRSIVGYEIDTICELYGEYSRVEDLDYDIEYVLSLIKGQ